MTDAAPRRSIARRLNPFSYAALQSGSAKVGVGLLVTIIVIILVGSFVTPYDPEGVSATMNRPPSYAHVFGTDWLGHDMFSQVVWGAYSSLFIALLGAFGSVILGLLVGVGAGYFARLRGVLSGASDVVMVFPALPLLILIGTVRPASDLFVASLLVLVMWPVVARVVRNQVSSVKRLAYIDAAKTSGTRDREVIFGIIIPEVAPIAIAYFILNAALAVVITTALEFLGVGNPAQASWGSILYWAQQFAFVAGDWWWVFFPGLFITLSATGFALIGFSIEEVINPRLRTS